MLGLNEEPLSKIDPIWTGIIYHVRHIGSCLVENERGEDTVSSAVKHSMMKVKHI